MDFSKLIPLFTEGVLSFFSPCVLPIIPLYLAYLTNSATHVDAQGRKHTSTLKFIGLTIAFVAGISVIFFIAAFSSSAIAQWLNRYALVLEYVAAFVIILFGLFYLGAIQIPWLRQDHKLPLHINVNQLNYLSAFLLGFLFTFGWTPCIGPMLGFAFSMAVSAGSDAFIYVMSFAAGFMVMFIALALAGKVVLHFIEKARSMMKWVSLVAGAVMVLMGCYVFYEAATSTLVLQDNQATIGSTNEETNQDSDSVEMTMDTLDFTLLDKEGNEVSLSDYKGKKTLVMFFGTWCGYCRQELPSLQEYADNHDDLNILLVSHPDSGINNETQESVDEFMAENGYTMDYVYDTGGSVSMYFTGGTFPANFFFNSDGTLLGQIPGAITMDQLISVVEDQMH